MQLSEYALPFATYFAEFLGLELVGISISINAGLRQWSLQQLNLNGDISLDRFAFLSGTFLVVFTASLLIVRLALMCKFKWISWVNGQRRSDFHEEIQSLWALGHGEPRA